MRVSLPLHVNAFQTPKRGSPQPVSAAQLNYNRVLEERRGGLFAPPELCAPPPTRPARTITNGASRMIASLNLVPSMPRLTCRSGSWPKP